MTTRPELRIGSLPKSGRPSSSNATNSPSASVPADKRRSTSSSGAANLAATSAAGIWSRAESCSHTELRLTRHFFETHKPVSRLIRFADSGYVAVVQRPVRHARIYLQGLGAAARRCPSRSRSHPHSRFTCGLAPDIQQFPLAFNSVHRYMQNRPQLPRLQLFQAARTRKPIYLASRAPRSPGSARRLPRKRGRNPAQSNALGCSRRIVFRGGIPCET
jgi:hypothetical protein